MYGCVYRISRVERKSHVEPNKTLVLISVTSEFFSFFLYLLRCYTRFQFYLACMRRDGRNTQDRDHACYNKRKEKEVEKEPVENRLNQEMDR